MAGAFAFADAGSTVVSKTSAGTTLWRMAPSGEVKPPTWQSWMTVAQWQFSWTRKHALPWEVHRRMVAVCSQKVWKSATLLRSKWQSRA